MNKTKKTLLHPAWLMLGFWTFLYVIYFLAPINQTPPISTAGTAFVISHILVFCVGTVLGAGGVGVGLRRKVPTFSPPSSRVLGIINAFLLIGITGACLIILEKILTLDLFSLYESAALRTERAQQLLHAMPLSSTALSGIGFLTYPAGFVAIVLTLVLYESLPRTTRALSGLYVLAIFILSIATGGRSAIFVTMLFLGLALYIRNRRGLSTIPRSRLIKILFLLLLACFIGYSTLIWQTRAELSGQSVDEFLRHVDEDWGVTPTESLESLVLALGQPNLMRNVISSIFYFTQSVSVIERILGMPEVPVLLGAYHIDLVAAAVRAFSDSPDFLVQGYAALLESNVYGFFTSAWGALYIDFGFLGSYMAALLWGMFAGLAHRHARKTINPDGNTQYVFWMYSILISFISPPFGFSNSAVIFFWFLFYRFLRSWKGNAGFRPIRY